MSKCYDIPQPEPVTERAFPGESSLGLSMYDYVAAKAMQGLLAEGWCPSTGLRYPALVKHAYDLADAFMSEREIRLRARTP